MLLAKKSSTLLFLASWIAWLFAGHNLTAFVAAQGNACTQFPPCNSSPLRRYPVCCRGRNLCVAFPSLFVNQFGCKCGKCPTSGKCCKYVGYIPYDCASIEGLGPGADLDGRCNQVNAGNSCTWNYADPDCCKIAVADQFGTVTSQQCSAAQQGKSGDCCKYTGPVSFDCSTIDVLPAGADYDGRCNQVNTGLSCSWNYGNPQCCKKAVTDGTTGNVVC